MKAKKRLPRHKRIANPPPMQLTARDRAVVKAVYAYRFLRQDQVQALLFPSKWSAQYRLVRLYQHRYLHRLFTAVPFGRGKTIYCLDDRGADLIAAELGVDRGRLRWSRKGNRVGGQFLEHTLAVNGARIALELACHSTGCRLEKWVDERDLKQEHSRKQELVHLRNARGGSRQVAVIADGYFVLQCSDRRGHFFLEADRATIANKRWRQKIRAYTAYYHSGKYQAKYKTRSLRVLTITTGEKRLANLKMTTEKAGGGIMYWFTTFEEATPDNILTIPIWRVAGQEGQHASIAANSPRKKLDGSVKVWYDRSV